MQLQVSSFEHPPLSEQYVVGISQNIRDRIIIKRILARQLRMVGLVSLPVSYTHYIRAEANIYATDKILSLLMYAFDKLFYQTIVLTHIIPLSWHICHKHVSASSWCICILYTCHKVGGLSENAITVCKKAPW